MNRTAVLVVTGAGGFVGRHLVSRPAAARFESVVALSRGEGVVPRGQVRNVRLDILSAHDWVPPRGCVLIHLAAATGAAPARVLERVNVDGTARVIELARAADAALVHVSTIAVRYPEDPAYPYARSKRRAEELVAASGLPHLILRPTVVLGPDGPIWRRFRSMAAGMARLTVGDGSARIQPIHVDDLADLMIEAAATGPFEGQVWELGGPEVITMGGLLAALRAALGLAPAPLVRLPHSLLRPALRAAELLLGDRAPVRAGQITALVRDSVAQPNPLWEANRERMLGIDAMLRVLTRG